jgi:hypothetical protein
MRASRLGGWSGKRRPDKAPHRFRPAYRFRLRGYPLIKHRQIVFLQTNANKLPNFRRALAFHVITACHDVDVVLTPETGRNKGSNLAPALTPTMENAMSEAALGHIAPRPDSSCGNRAAGSTTRRAMLAMAAGALALPAAAKGVHVVDTLAPEEPAVALFRQWVALINHRPAAGLPAAQADAITERAAARQEMVQAQLLALPHSPVQAAAAIWVMAWDVHGSVDPRCAALPHRRDADMRALVLCAARLQPGLAAIAGVRP